MALLLSVFILYDCICLINTIMIAFMGGMM